MFLTSSKLNKTNTSYIKCGICLTLLNLNKTKYFHNGCDMCLNSQIRTKLITVIKDMANCRYKRSRYEYNSVIGIFKEI